MWEVLGITATHDIKKIKRAYAKMLTKYHPEDNPEKFLEIQEAYKYAIRYAKNSNDYNYDGNKNIAFPKVTEKKEEKAEKAEEKTGDIQTEISQKKIIFEKSVEEVEGKTEEPQQKIVKNKTTFEKPLEEQKVGTETPKTEIEQKKIIFEKSTEEVEGEAEESKQKIVQKKTVYQKVAEKEIEQQREEQQDTQEHQDAQEKQTDQIPDYIKTITIEKSEEIISKERKIMNQYINRITDSLNYKKRSEVLKMVQFLNSDEFYEIALRKEFYKELSRELKRKYSGNVIILKTLKNVYESMNFLGNEDLDINIITVLEERISILEQREVENTKKVAKWVICALTVGIILISIIVNRWNKIQIENKIPNANEICSLIKEQYSVDIPPESVHDDNIIEDLYQKNKSNEKSFYCSIAYMSNEGDKIRFNSLFRESMDTASETVFDFERQLCREYIEKYLNDYIDKDITSSANMLDSFYIGDGTQIYKQFDITEEQIDSFVDKFYEFKEAYWSEIPVNSRDTEYIFTVHFYNGGEYGYLMKPDRDDVEIKLSTSNAELDKEELRNKIRGD